LSGWIFASRVLAMLLVATGISQAGITPLTAASLQRW
jgi:hypothetical protein